LFLFSLLFCIYIFYISFYLIPYVRNLKFKKKINNKLYSLYLMQISFLFLFFFIFFSSLFTQHNKTTTKMIFKNICKIFLQKKKRTKNHQHHTSKYYLYRVINFFLCIIWNFKLYISFYYYYYYYLNSNNNTEELIQILIFQQYYLVERRRECSWTVFVIFLVVY
jgi:hypothetical protein